MRPHAWLAMLALCSVSCGAATPPVSLSSPDAPGAEPEPRPNPLSALPADTLLLLHVDMARLRQWAPFAALVARLSDTPDSDDRALGSLALALSDVYLGVAAETWTVVATGTLGAEPQARLVLGLGRLSGQEVAAIALDGGMVVAGPPGELEGARRRVLDRAGDPQVLDSILMRAMRDRYQVGRAAATLLARVPEPIQRDIARDLGARVVALGARGDVLPEFDFEATAECKTEQGAILVAASLNRSLREVRGQFMVTLLGLAPLLNGTTVTAEGNAVRMAAHLSQEDAAALVRMAERFMTGAGHLPGGLSLP